MEFEKKTAIITGAASGMGLLCSECFVREGGNVVMVDINPDTLAVAVEKVNGIRSGSAYGVICDVRDYAQVQHVCEEAVRVFSSIDLLVNFAGGAATRIRGIQGLEFPDIPIEVFDWSLEVNLRAQFYFAHAALKYMRHQNSGVIVNIGSITGEEGHGTDVGYATSKSAAMNGLTKSLALYGGQYGIRCVCVSPGPVLTRAAMANMKTLLNRAAQPQEIVDLILYLASEKAAFVTGINVLADGGRAILKNKE